MAELADRVAKILEYRCQKSLHGMGLVRPDLQACVGPVRLFDKALISI
jgi:hypothetical protein